ncbi:MAG: CotH kinase family protein, partial [Planctomycetes bacterium]|nr:CotH kinase family protein [Planctomycetota bacterium]
LHTNFKLTDGGEYLALVRPDGQVIHEFAPEYPEQFENISYGFAGNGVDETPGYMETPTPGEPNATVFPAVSRKPTITNAADGRPVSTHAFTDNFSILLSSPEPGAMIRYTTEDPLTNRPTPPAEWTLASGPININSVTKLRTISFVPGQIPSRVRAEAFFKVDAGTAAFTSNLPILMIDTFRTTNNSVQTAGHMAFFEPNGVTGLASVSDVPASSSRIGIKWRGSSTANFDKHPYALELWEDGLNDDRNISLAGMPAESDWVLQGPWNFDRSFTRNSFIYELSRQVGIYATRTQLVEVFLNRWIAGGLGSDSNVNLISGGGNFSGDYQGVYVLIEKIKQGDDRVDIGGEISPNFPAVPVAVDADGNLLQGDVTGGFMFKVDRLDPGDSGFSAAGQGFGYVYPKEIDIKLPEWDNAEKYLTNYLNAFNAALNAPNNTFTHPSLGLHYSEFIDVQSFIDHHILNELMWNVDAFRLSTYYKKIKNGKIHAEPIWDFDRSAESVDGRDDNPRTWYGSRFFGWWNRLLNQDPDFAQAWIDRWTEWRRDEFSIENMFAIHDVLREQLVPDLNDQGFGPGENDERRWNRDARTSGPFNGGGELDGTVLGEIEHMNAWLEARVLWIDTAFLVAPTFSNEGGEIAPGFSLSIGNDNLDRDGELTGTIWYTLDGSDPRSPGGGISANAFEYDANDPDDIANRRLDQSTVVTARVFDDRFNSSFVSGRSNEHWSGLTSGIYTVDRPTLTITEVNYNPRSSTDDEIAAGFDDNDDLIEDADSLFEFVEIHNFGTVPIDLVADRVEFTNGVRFDFSQGDVPLIGPGDYVVVVFDDAAFRERYPDVSPDKIAGEFTSGTLRNSGERLTLENQFNQVLSTFRFEDGWYDITDGDGFTLSRRDDADTFADLDLKRAWRPSSDLLGSPGGPDSGTQPAPGAIVINEILTHSDDVSGDWIELLNTTSQPIDISGWYLSDEGDNLRKYRFRDDTMIPGGTVIGPGQFLVIDQFGQNGEVGFGDDPFNNPGAFGLSELGDSLRLSSVDPDLIRENIDAAHILPGGNLLISTGGAAVMGEGALTFGNGDLIEYDPATGQATVFFAENNFLVFDPTSMTFIPGGNEDIVAASINPSNGRLVLSTDGAALLPGVPGTPQVTDGVLSFGNGDLIEFDLISRTASLLLSEAIFTGGNENIDAVHVRGDGSLIISTAGPATIDGTLFDDGDLIEIIPGNNADLAAGNLGDNATVGLFVSESVFAIDAGNLEPTEDVDAVYVASGGAITLSTNSDAIFVGPLDFAFLNGDLVELTPGAGSDLSAVPAVLGAGTTVRKVFEENPVAGTTFLGEVAGYREQGSFGAAERDVTFGLHLKSDGTTDFTAQSAPTRGFANAPPLVGPVVINEIMYHPVQGEVEYIELLNITDQRVAFLGVPDVGEDELFIGWQFTNGVNFNFPEGVTLEAGEHILVLPTPPRLQFADFAAFETEFRANHGLPELPNDPGFVQIFGPYSGALNNNGEALELSKPGDPEPDGFVPMILVDRVRYDNRLPWPVEADGGRSSLSRKDPAAYGSDADNWAPSTNDGSPGRLNVSLDNSPPSVPGNVTAVVHLGQFDFQITVTWDASVDSQSGVAFYRVQRNGQIVENNFFATTYVDNDVEPNVTFIYEVSAVNGDDFESGPSGELPVNILDVPTVVATEVTQFDVIFDTVLDVASATNLSNYVVTGPNPVNITGASVDAAGRTVTLSTSRLLEDENYVVAIENVVASTPGSQLPVGTQVSFHVPDLTLPTIDAFQIRGSNWSPALLNRLEADGQGDDDGFDVPTGPDQLRTISWSGVDTVVIHFSEHVIISEDDLVITGVNRGGYPFSRFQYEADTFAGTYIATWTLSGAIAADRLVFNLKDSVHDPGDNAIDGNWINGANAFPSGNGQRESADNFQFRLNVLPGDAEGSEDVGRGDLLAVMRHIGRDASDAGYNARADVTADGQIDVDDLRSILLRDSTRLPTGSPSSENSLPVVATDEVFSRVGAAGSPAAAADAGVPLENTSPQAVAGHGSRVATRRDAFSDSGVAAQSLSRRFASGRRVHRLSNAAVDMAIDAELSQMQDRPASRRRRNRV